MMDSYKVFLFGLDNAGKTSLSETVKRGETYINEKPSMSINFETWKTENFNFQIWDLPGQISLRTVWRRSLYKTEIFLFVFDPSDTERYEEAKKELYGVIDHEDTAGMPLIICFHKYDLEESKENRNYAAEYLDLENVKNRDIFMLETTIFNLDTIKTLLHTMTSIIEKTIHDIRKELMSS